MNRLLKTFLLWLLIAALPLQGVAAVAKASCGQRHHPAMMAANAAGQESFHAHEDGATRHSHGDRHGTQLPAGHELPNPDTSSHSVTHAACSACAMCCVGAVAPPPSAAPAPESGKAGTAITSPVLSFTGFIPPGLERPPKFLSA